MWVLYSFAAAIFQSGARVSAQYFKLSGLGLTVSTNIFQLAACIPFLFFVPWPHVPAFYIFTALTAPLVAYQTKNIFDATTRFGAGAVSRVEPLSVPLVFLSWLVLHPDHLHAHLDHPARFSGIALCITLLAFFSIRMRRCPVNAETLKAVLPLVIVASMINILSKLAIDSAPHGPGIAVYIFVQSALVILTGAALWRGHMLADFKIRGALNKAILISVLMSAVMVFRLCAFIVTTNPSYVTAIMLTGPFWVMLFYRFAGYEEEGDVRSGVGIVISAIALMALAGR